MRNKRIFVERWLIFQHGNVLTKTHFGKSDLQKDLSGGSFDLNFSSFTHREGSQSTNDFCKGPYFPIVDELGEIKRIGSEPEISCLVMSVRVTQAKFTTLNNVSKFMLLGNDNGSCHAILAHCLMWNELRLKESTYLQALWKAMMDWVPIGIFKQWLLFHRSWRNTDP